MEVNKDEFHNIHLGKEPDESRRLIFPSGFLWGAATSAHQVEGNNRNDWTEWENKNAARLAKNAKFKWQPWQQEKFPEMFDPSNYISGEACDHYNRYEEDFDIAKTLGHNVHRFSIEWSRIEPHKGVFEKDQLAHYRAVIKALKQRGIEPFVTLWHWTLPVWLAKEDGVLNKNFSKYFLRYADFVVNGLKDNVSYWMTLNEPTSVIGAAYFSGMFPPQKRNIFSVFKAYKNLADANNIAYKKIHQWSLRAKVGVGHALIDLEPANSGSFIDSLLVKIGNYFANEKMLRMISGSQDFIGVQYYRREKLSFTKSGALPQESVSDMGWEIYPDGLYKVLKSVSRFKLPIFVTENGIADKADGKRGDYIKDHLAAVHKAINEGVDVRGYFYWSLLDNFEWDKGFWLRFGLVGVDYKTQERTIRKSAYIYSDIIKGGGTNL